MGEDETTLYLLVIVVIVAVLGLGLAVASFATDESMSRMMGGGGGGMMGGPAANATSTPGGLEWGILVVSAAFLVLAIILIFRGRRPQGRRDEVLPPSAGAPFVPESLRAPEPGDANRAPPAPLPTSVVAEPTLVKLLDDDERRMYLELRDHGGQMFQRDIVALGTFSKAKVTRVLDKLEAKGLVVREAHGMTNRVRLVNLPAK